MKLIYAVLLLFLILVPQLAVAQINCAILGAGTTVCDSARGSTSITELSPGMGIITTDRETIPYSIIGRDEDRRSSYDSTPLPELERLPSSNSYGSSERSKTFEERQAIRESGRIPW